MPLFRFSGDALFPVARNHRRWTEALEEIAMALSKELLDILACPKCKGDIHLNQTEDGLVCDACRLMYPIKDDIPVMLIDEAVRL
jgi:uncharacterized protein YbaR (Trm112 family)